jgi:molybdopterin-containing oxidoreductase family iron-sulfur binding subunit
MSKERQDQRAMARSRRSQAGPQSRYYWKSLEELAQGEELGDFIDDRFPQALALAGGVKRREFLRLMGASLALAGLAACARKPEEQIVPYVQAPEEMIPGKPLYFATAFLLGGFATGIIVESHEGRPTKIEGNPNHPASLGATHAFAQAAILELYDPERSQVTLEKRRISTWDAFVSAATTRLQAQSKTRGSGLRILTGRMTSPTAASQIQAFLETHPRAKWHSYEPVSLDNKRRGAVLAFGADADSIYRLDRAQVILALDSDFLFAEPGSLRYARDFAEQRRVRGGQARLNRLYVAEPTPSITGAMADHRLPVAAGLIDALSREIARHLGIESAPSAHTAALAPHRDWIEAVARDLAEHRGRSLVAVGEFQPPAVHALAHALNERLGNIGQTVIHTPPAALEPEGSLKDLVSEMQQGAVEDLYILGGNPVFNAPADIPFAEALRKVPFSVHLGLYENETSYSCRWHIPEAHSLESWGDARSFDGTATILQPLIAPLYGGKSIYEVLALMNEKPAPSGYDAVRGYWQSQIRDGDFETWWRRALHDGMVPDTSGKPGAVSLRAPDLRREETTNTTAAPGLEIIFRPDPTLWDGSFANNGWLQELPKPITKLTWDNAALVSPELARKLAINNGDELELRFHQYRVTAPAWISPGQAEDSVTVHFGYGRTRVGRVGFGAGFDAYRLRTSAEPWIGQGLALKKTGARKELATTQRHHSMEGRQLVRVATVGDFQRHPELVHEMGHEPPSHLTLNPAHPNPFNAWGMAIDTNVCIGCNACVVACQAENNIPVVGKNEVARGREMHWLRIDRYYAGQPENPQILHQPVPCMHCENAPCESVCPVGATVHSSEGLNEMVYNRCVGTRYCANNCPYKVRRFNFYQYADFDTAAEKLGRNPNVTVRSRGVMEKCTYCVQRINQARIEAKKENRPIRDGEVVTACQQACPTQAISFGDIKDPHSAVSQAKSGPLNYNLLAELNTRPRTSYLARLKNPNTKIKEN